jgi:hypothetical protein
LFIARGAETDGTNGAIGMLLMGLNIAPEFETNVFPVVEMFAGQQIAR